MKTFFKLDENNTTVSKEILCGITTFLTMSYILFINPLIVSKTGMPHSGIFMATVLSAAITTIVMAFYSNTPYAMAPGMGLNTFFAYTLCIGMDFHWKEALFIIFASSLLHIISMWVPGLREKFRDAIPSSMKLASCIGMGIFIAYVGIKNAGFLRFTMIPDAYEYAENGVVIGNAMTVPGFQSHFTLTQVIAVIGLVVTIYLLALEKKTGDNYSPFLLGIIGATFVGVPLDVTNLKGITLVDLSAFQELKEVAVSFFGFPGFMSIIQNPVKIVLSLFMILIVWSISLINSYSTVVGINQIKKADFSDQNLEKSIVASSLGGLVSSLLGTTPAIVFVESISGISAGGKTGLTSLVVGILFLICLPFSNIFAMIPLAAVTPALIIAGCYMFSLLEYNDWNNIEEVTSAAVLIIAVPLTYSITDGIAIGYFVYIIMKVATGKWREVHPILYFLTVIFVIVIILRSVLRV